MIVDIGSNTVKYDLFEIENDRFYGIRRGSVAVRLLRYIENGVLSNEGLDALCRTLLQFKKEAEEFSCGDISAFATASLRRLDDPMPTLEKVKEKTGLSVRLLSGEEEAACSFRGMCLTVKDLPEKGVMLDMGGGSTELNFFENKRSLCVHSCPFGALSTKMLFHIDVRLEVETRKAFEQYVRGVLPKEIERYLENGKNAVIVGGTAKACLKLAVAFGCVSPSACSLSIDEFDTLCAILTSPTDEQYETMKKICPERYELMASGMSGFSCLFENLKTEKIYICPGGIREGYLSLVTGNDSLIYEEV